MSEDASPAPDDVAVIGGGPAALALAGAICAARPETTLRLISADAPQHPRFDNNYGAFARAIPQYYSVCTAHTYPKTHVAFAGKNERVLNEPYVRFDNEKLQAALSKRLSAVKITAGKVNRVEAQEDNSHIHTQDGQRLSASLVIDATGFHSRLLRRQYQSGEPLYQRAFGHILRTDRPLFAPDAMRLMDFAPAPRFDQAPLQTPTFLYAMPLDADAETHRVFVEETQLTGEQQAPFDSLEGALKLRTQSLCKERGVRLLGVEDTLVEKCHIVMNRPLPRFDQNVLGFGAAASFVNPATGYSIATTLSRAESAGAAIARWLDAPAATRPPAFTLWPSIWNERDLHAHDFYTKGGAIIATFNQKDLITFFSAFFRLDDATCYDFLTRHMEHAELLRTGFKMARHFPFGLKGRFISRFAKETARARG